jgi:VanZ family protein
MAIMWIRLGFLETGEFKWNYIKIVIFIAIITEFCQGFLPIGRYFEIADIIANMTGILIAFFLSKIHILKNKHS